MITVDRVVVDAGFSVFRYLRDVQYEVGNDTGTLRDFFPGLKFEEAYPDDLTRLKFPTLCIQSVDIITDGPLYYYDNAIIEKQFDIPIYGFVVGQRDFRPSVLYRDRLLNDLVYLLSAANDDGVIPLYEQASKQEIGDLEILRTRGRLVPANALEVEAERYKFTLDVSVSAAIARHT